MSDFQFWLKPIEASSIITGICGLIFGAAQYKRARAAESRATSAEERAQRAETRALDTERRNLELAAASEKDQALVEAHTTRAAFDLLRWKTSTLRAEALALGDAVAANECDENARSLANLCEPCTEIEAELRKVSPESATHETLMVIKEYRTKLRRCIADKDLNEKRVDDYLLEVKRGLEIRRRPPRSHTDA